MNIEAVLHDVRKASSRLALLDEKQINEILLAVADAAMEHCEDILKANVEDLGRMDVANPKYDRLKLTRERLEAKCCSFTISFGPDLGRKCSS